MLDTIELETSINPSASIIWMHGLGADGNDFVPIIPSLDLEPELSLRYIFPHAPERAVTINNHNVMRAWYDITDLGDLRENEQDIRRSGNEIEKLIKREIERGIKSNRIVLVGFSQGGAMALYTALRCAKPLAGIIALSSYLPLAAFLPQELTAANAKIPIFMAHGTFDTVIPLIIGERSRSQLTSLDFSIEWHTYPMGHEVCGLEISQIKSWLRKNLGDKP